MMITLPHTYLWTLKVAEGEPPPKVATGVKFSVTAGPLGGLQGQVVDQDYDRQGEQYAKVELPTEEVLDRMRQHLIRELDLLPGDSEREYVLQEALSRIQRRG